MDTILQELKMLVSFLVGGGVIVSILLRMSKSAVVLAVEQAGKREIVKIQAEHALSVERERALFAKELEATRQSFTRELERDKLRTQIEYAELLEGIKARLARELEEERQRFAREMEEQRASAAHQIEAFKATLTLDAEVRRQAAAKKVQALLDIVEMGEPLLRTVMNSPPSDSARLSEMMVNIHNFVDLVRRRRHFFLPDAMKSLDQYAPDLIRARSDYFDRNDTDAPYRALAKCEEFIDLVRTELGIATRGAHRSIVGG